MTTFDILPFNMKFQRTNILKPLLFIALLVVVLWITFSSIRNSVLMPATNSLGKVVPLTENAISKRDSLVDYSMELLGTPYVATGSGTNGFDCSGFVYHVYNRFQIVVPRSSPQYANFGKVVPIDKVQKGDILVFLSPTSNAIGHLGIVTNPKGMQSDFIHATSGREMKVVISSLKVEGYKQRFIKAVGVIN